jgi:hypothetical protein
MFRVVSPSSDRTFRARSGVGERIDPNKIALATGPVRDGPSLAKKVSAACRHPPSIVIAVTRWCGAAESKIVAQAQVSVIAATTFLRFRDLIFLASTRVPSGGSRTAENF